MDNKTRGMLSKRFDKIEKLCQESLDIIEKADQEGDDNTDYFALEDAANYLWRIKEECEEAQGQWWA